MSRSRTAERLRRYSLCPERESRRVTTTSWYASGSVPSELSNTSDTSATLTGRRPVDPWKITSSIFPPRSRRGDCSPSTQRTASEMLDLPHPLGPTIAVTPASNGSSTVPANDLKPDSSSRLSLMPGGLSRLGLRLVDPVRAATPTVRDRKSTRLNSSHLVISYAVFCLKKKKTTTEACGATHVT